MEKKKEKHCTFFAATLLVAISTVGGSSAVGVGILDGYYSIHAIHTPLGSTSGLPATMSTASSDFWRYRRYALENSFPVSQNSWANP